MQIAQGGDRILRWHSGSHQSPDDLGDIYGVDSGPVQNPEHTLLPSLIQQNAQQSGCIQDKLLGHEREASASSRATSACRSRIKSPTRSTPAGMYFRISART